MGQNELAPKPPTLLDTLSRQTDRTRRQEICHTAFVHDLGLYQACAKLGKPLRGAKLPEERWRISALAAELSEAVSLSEENKKIITSKKETAEVIEEMEGLLNRAGHIIMNQVIEESFTDSLDELIEDKLNKISLIEPKINRGVAMALTLKESPRGIIEKEQWAFGKTSYGKFGVYCESIGYFTTALAKDDIQHAISALIIAQEIGKNSYKDVINDMMPIDWRNKHPQLIDELDRILNGYGYYWDQKLESYLRINLAHIPVERSL